MVEILSKCTEALKAINVFNVDINSDKAILDEDTTVLTIELGRIGYSALAILPIFEFGTLRAVLKRCRPEAKLDQLGGYFVVITCCSLRFVASLSRLPSQGLPLPGLIKISIFISSS